MKRGTLAILLAFAAGPLPATTPCSERTGPAETPIAAGTRVRARPDAASPSLAVVDADVSLPALSWCGPWAEIRWGGLRGWVRGGDVGGPALERAARSAEAARLARVLEAMHPPGHETRLGPWRLVTNASDAQREGLETVASGLAGAYRERTGLETQPGTGQTVAIFATEATYRAFADADAGTLRGTSGHAGGGLAAFAAAKSALETRVRLVHELTHLLSRNALGETPPVWLDEGLAEDLAWCRVDKKGRLEPGTLDERTATAGSPTGVVLERSGPRVTVDTWLGRARSGRVATLRELLAPDARLFSDPDARRDASTESALLVRFCLATPERGARFREFLRMISFGGAGDANALAAALETDINTLSKKFLEWSRNRAIVP